MYKEAIRPAWVEVNLSNLDYNIKQIKEKANGRELIGVIKRFLERTELRLLQSQHFRKL